MLLFLFVSPLAAAAQPLPLADETTSKVLLQSGVTTTIPLAAQVDDCVLRPVGLLDPDKGLDPRREQIKIEQMDGALHVALDPAASLQPGAWTILLQATPTPTEPASAPATGDEVEAGATHSAACSGIHRLSVQVPAATLEPVEALIKLTRIAPVSYDIPPQGLWSYVDELACPKDAYPQCVDARVPVQVKEVGATRRACDWLAVVSVERWGPGVNADLPPDVYWSGVPEEEQASACVDPGTSMLAEVQLPDNIPLGSSLLTLHMRSPAMGEDLSIPIEVDVRRSLLWLFLATIAGAALKLVHQALLPAIRHAHALRRHIQRMQRVTIAMGAPPSDLNQIAPLLNRGVIDVVWNRAAYTEQARDAHDSLQAVVATHPAALSGTGEPPLPPFPTDQARPLVPVVIETALGILLLCLFVYVSYSASFVGTPAELAGLLAFAYAANLGLDPLMTELTQKVGRLVPPRPPARDPAASLTPDAGARE